MVGLLVLIIWNVRGLTLMYGVDRYTEKLLFEDVLKLLPKLWFRVNFRRVHETKVAAAYLELVEAK